MLLNPPIDYYALKELICQDKYKKIKYKVKHENTRSTKIAHFV